MCGRGRCTLRPDAIPRACHLDGRPVRSVNIDRYRPSHNVAPGWTLPVVRREDGSDGQGVVIECMKWGLIPSFTKKTEKPDHYRMFNARSESIGEKASFRRLIPNSRCLVVMEGFYEWKKDGSKKQPYYIHFKDERPLVLAALYDTWKNSEGEALYTFTIITTSSSSALEWLHDRMPVILHDKDSIDAWLVGSSTSKYDALLKPYEEPDLVWYPVTPAMGKPSFDGPECIKEIQLKAGEQSSISKFFVKKGIKEEKELNPDDRSACKDPTESDQSKNPKEEPEEDEGGEHFCTTKLETIKKEPETQGGIERDAEDSKPHVSTHQHPLGGAPNSQIKHEDDDDELRARKRPISEGTNTVSASQAKKKKGGTTTLKKGAAGDKQPTLTLLSYFGKG